MSIIAITNPGVARGDLCSIRRLKMNTVSMGAGMPYAILRTKKLKAITGVLGSGRHTFREMPTPNSDSTPSMRMAGATSAVELGRAVLARFPQKRRKGAVICIEYLITASPEAFARHGRAMPDTGGYFDRALAWLKARHGSANIVCAEVHLDERTPHLVAYITPLTRDGRLSAHDFLGGPAKLRKMQTDLHPDCLVVLRGPKRLTRRFPGITKRSLQSTQVLPDQT